MPLGHCWLNSDSCEYSNVLAWSKSIICRTQLGASPLPVILAGLYIISLITSGSSLSLFSGTCSSCSLPRNPNSSGSRSNLFLLILSSFSLVSAHISTGRYLRKLLSILSFSRFMRLQMSRGILVSRLLFRFNVVRHLRLTTNNCKYHLMWEHYVRQEWITFYKQSIIPHKTSVISWSLISLPKMPSGIISNWFWNMCKVWREYNVATQTGIVVNELFPRLRTSSWKRGWLKLLISNKRTEISILVQSSGNPC